MPFIIPMDFSFIPDNTKLGPIFTFAGTTFQDLPGASFPSFVNVNGGVKGLQFADAGIEIALLTPVPWASLQVGQFNAPLTIEGIDSNGTITNTWAFNNPSSYWFVYFTKGDLVMIRCTGGGNEAAIVSLFLFVP